MRQFDTLRKRYDPRSQWFQVGLASATLLTPLLKRWNDLRAAEQARAWRDEAEARLHDVRAWNPLRKNDAHRKAREAIEQVGAPRGNVSATIWLAGVGIGLVAAGTGAYFLVRRRMRQEREEPMLDLPMPPNGNNAHLRETTRAVAEGIRQRDEQAASAAAWNGAPPAQTGPLMPTTAATETAPAPAPTTQMSEPGEMGALPGSATAVTESVAPAGVTDANNAAFVGNIHTMVYHAADAADLPAEENRIYFASEDEAHDAGYRRARDEVSSGGE